MDVDKSNSLSWDELVKGYRYAFASGCKGKREEVKEFDFCADFDKTWAFIK